MMNQQITNVESKETLKQVMNKHLKQMDIDAIRCKQTLENISNKYHLKLFCVSALAKKYFLMVNINAKLFFSIFAKIISSSPKILNQKKTFFVNVFFKNHLTLIQKKLIFVFCMAYTSFIFYYFCKFVFGANLGGRKIF